MKVTSSSAKADLAGSLPEPIWAACEPLFVALPLERAMPSLLPAAKADSELLKLAERAMERPAIAGNPELGAGLLLYVDDLHASHGLSQGISSAAGLYWHAIMHRREGDFGNSKYWLQRAGRHPMLDAIPGFDPVQFVEAVRNSHKANPADLVEWQRAEWAALFGWCARNGKR
jgi:hypothetical protein